MALRAMSVLRAPTEHNAIDQPTSGPSGRVARATSIDAAGGLIDSATEREIEAGRSSGHPLGGRIRRRMEGAFGADFSNVRMHVDARSDDLNERIHGARLHAGR